MNTCLLSRLSAAVRWQSALSCRHLRTGIVSRSQELGDDGLPKDYKVKTLKAGSRRLDTFVNRASGKSSSQVEKLILGGRVRVNEDVHTKKSYNVQKDDCVDVWIGPYPENSDLAEVERYENHIEFGSSAHHFIPSTSPSVPDLNVSTPPLGSHYSQREMNSSAASALRIALFVCATVAIISSAPSRQKRAFDTFAGSFSGFDKRAFDSLAGSGFSAFDKRAFDSLSGSGLTPFNKRAFDSLAGSGFTGFDKRSPIALNGGYYQPLREDALLL